MKGQGRHTIRCQGWRYITSLSRSYARVCCSGLAKRCHFLSYIWSDIYIVAPNANPKGNMRNHGMVNSVIRTWGSFRQEKGKFCIPVTREYLIACIQQFNTPSISTLRRDCDCPSLTGFWLAGPLGFNFCKNGNSCKSWVLVEILVFSQRLVVYVGIDFRHQKSFFLLFKGWGSNT
jgi:hypothetical protein